MSRPASGEEVLERAKECLKQARTVEEFRQAQAVILPLVYGLKIDQVADAIGVSIGWACQLRTRFIRDGGVHSVSRATDRDKPRRKRLSRAEEAEFLDPYLRKADTDRGVVIKSIKEALEALLGRTVALATVYNLLHRHGWRRQRPRANSVPSE